MKEEKLRELLADMSLREKIGQMSQLMTYFFKDGTEAETDAVVTGPEAEMGLTQEDVALLGSVLSSHGAKELIDFQKKYMQKHPHHIPILFMLDVIHGFRTVVPSPLGQGASWDPELSRECAAMAAREAAAAGVHITFAPMVDLVRDARWGRVVESTGEDPYLNSQFSQAMVRGFQGDDLAAKDTVAACIKHFAGYGAPVAGRDYNTVELSRQTFRDQYLPAYKAGVDAGAALVMTSFNTVEGIPATVNPWLMRTVLRDEMGFDGVLITDFGAIAESIVHGCSEDAADAAARSVEAGVDIDMMTGIFSAQLPELVEKGIVPEKLIDEAAWRILQLKNKLGLFENPFKGADPQKEEQIILCPEHRALARKAARESFVLLKNEDGILPLDTSRKIAFIGPYTDCHEITSSWAFISKPEESVSIQDAASKIFNPDRTTYAEGCSMLGKGVCLEGFGAAGMLTEERSEEELAQLLEEAKKQAAQADLVVMPLGEHYQQSGEAASRAFLDLPASQMELFREIYKINPNIVVVLFNGRPLDLREISEKAKAVLDVWYPGTEGGNAIVDVLTGQSAPEGKLPMSFPYCVGQVPVYYNQFMTGRPNVGSGRFFSKYTDIPNEPLYPFGYGLSYTTFEISGLELSASSLTGEEQIIAEACITNTGKRTGTDTVQLYIRDVTGSVVRPIRELKGFEKVTLEPGESRKVSFEITEQMLRFYHADGTFASEPGKFQVWIGDCSDAQMSAEFELK